MTCGGGAASTDMMLAVIAGDHGADFAAMVSDMCLRTVLPGVAPEQRTSVAALMSKRNPVLVATVNLMNRRIDTPMSMDELAEAAGYSRRHLSGCSARRRARPRASSTAACGWTGGATCCRPRT